MLTLPANSEIPPRGRLSRKVRRFMALLCDMRNSERSILHNRILCNARNLAGMKKPESPRRARRRAMLIKLLDEFGGPAQVARETGTPKSHFSALVAGERGLGDALAAKLEGVYNKPEGWFDSDGGIEGPPGRPGNQNALTERLVALEIAVEGLAPELRSVGRDALRKWASEDASASETASTLEALAAASRALATQKKPNGASGPLGKVA